MAWLTDPTFAVALLVAFLVMMGLWLWLRDQMAVSKARFALFPGWTLRPRPPDISVRSSPSSDYQCCSFRHQERHGIRLDSNVS